MKVVSKRRLPVNFSQKDQSIFSHELIKEFDSPEILELKNLVFDRNFTFFSSKKERNPLLIEKTNWYIFDTKKQLFFFVLKKGIQPILIPVLIFTDTWSGGYFHWILDALPRLYLALKEYDIKKIYLPDSFKKFSYVIPSLQSFGIEKVVFMNSKHLYLARKVIFPTHLAPTGNYNEEILEEMRRYCSKNKILSKTKPHKRIYISRSKSEKRKVSNEDELLNSLSKYNFETVYTEDLSFREQVELFYQTKYLVGNHGAGLTNIIFMQANSSVMELRKENDTINNCYFSLASASKVNYYYQLCEAENPEEDSHTANIRVDIETLEKELKNFVQ